MQSNNIRDIREALLKASTIANFAGIITSPESAIEEIREILKPISAIHIRNCDVGTAEERMHRYQALCREIDERHERFGEHAPAFAFPTPFAWEDRPYESEEARREDV